MQYVEWETLLAVAAAAAAAAVESMTPASYHYLQQCDQKTNYSSSHK